MFLILKTIADKELRVQIANILLYEQDQFNSEIVHVTLQDYQVIPVKNKIEDLDKVLGTKTPDESVVILPNCVYCNTNKYQKQTSVKPKKFICGTCNYLTV